MTKRQVSEEVRTGFRMWIKGLVTEAEVYGEETIGETKDFYGKRDVFNHLDFGMSFMQGRRDKSSGLGQGGRRVYKSNRQRH